MTAPYRARVEAGLLGYMDASGAPSPLLDAMRYSLLSGGKRLRPVLLLLACEAGGGDAEAALPFACALEMIHAYSLIHDDLPAMDDDDVRRGRPTNHRVYGEGMAILAGDALLTLAFETMAEAVETAAHIRAMRYIAQAAGATGMVGGQCVDLRCEWEGGCAEAELSYIHLHKTADLFIAAATAGLAVAGAPADWVGAGEAYARALGTAFQIQDDLLDIEGDTQALGKRTGMDAARGKLTWPGVYGAERARADVTARMDEAMAALAPLGGKAARLEDFALSLMGRDR